MAYVITTIGAKTKKGKENNFVPIWSRSCAKYKNGNYCTTHGDSYLSSLLMFLLTTTVGTYFVYASTTVRTRGKSMRKSL